MKFHDHLFQKLKIIKKLYRIQMTKLTIDLTSVLRGLSTIWVIWGYYQALRDEWFRKYKNIKLLTDISERFSSALYFTY